MIEQEWTYLDRSTWRDGPWKDEPDKRQWTDALTGLPCMIRRGGGGAWCGYVGVAQGHPLHGKNIEQCDALEVHGGVTLCTACEGDEVSAICHIPEPGEPDAVWWIGFDCLHSGDSSPAMEPLFEPLFGSGEYRDMHYVMNECALLALRLSAMEP